MTTISKYDDDRKGYIKDEPKRFISNHHRKGLTGKLNPNWKGGIVTKSNGYVFIHNPTHTHVNKQGYVREHILVAEITLGQLNICEVVHHIDENKANNRPENLIVFPNNAEHTKFHAALKAFRDCGCYNWKKCGYCHNYDDPVNLIPNNSRGYYHQSCQNNYKRQRYMREI